MSGMSDPLAQLLPATISDTVDLAFVPRAIWVGTAGDLTVMDTWGVGPTTLSNLNAGWHPIRVKRIYSTGTSAADIVIGR